MNYYLKLIDLHDTFGNLEKILETAADDESITNEEYCHIYSYALEKARRET